MPDWPHVDLAARARIFETGVSVVTSHRSSVPARLFVALPFF
jgi:hypothetical protein